MFDSFSPPTRPAELDDLGRDELLELARLVDGDDREAFIEFARGRHWNREVGRRIWYWIELDADVGDFATDRPAGAEA